MQEKIIYVCENCGKEFDAQDACEEHEDNCMDKIKFYTDQLSNTISIIKSNYGNIITNIDFKITDNSLYSEGHYVSIYNANINFVLSNNNKGTVVINLNNNQNEYIKIIEQEIDDKIPMEYSGIIHIDDDDGWYTPKIGDVEFLNIAQRLDGRKVKLEVIE